MTSRNKILNFQVHWNTVKTFFFLHLIQSWILQRIKIKQQCNRGCLDSLQKVLKSITGANMDLLIFIEALNVDRDFFFHLGSGNSGDVACSSSAGFWDGQSHLIRAAGGHKTNPSAALHPCWPNFFCSAYCEHTRQRAVSCVRLSLQEVVTKRCTENNNPVERIS